jgi:peptidoglycan/xylan/chitin deacetylase (PgdA/CDA1 family)
LYCFNYHRIGQADLTEYDPNVFSCDEDNFAAQMEYIKKHFILVTLDDISEILEEKEINKKYALITFDDGYIDNYTKAFPILKKLNISATFFLATNFINDNEIPWWDKIAYLVRNSQVDKVKLSHWGGSIHFSKHTVAENIQKVLHMVKSNRDQTIDDALLELEHELKIKPVVVKSIKPLFMTWEMVKAMKAAGMDFGSQTCSHRIMSHLSLNDQDYEAKASKEVIEKEIACNVKAFAYPVGSKASFTSETIEIIKKHYEFSFSFIAGINTAKTLNIFSIERISVDSNCNADEFSYRLLKLYLNKLNTNFRK